MEMKMLNQCNFIGNVGKDPEARSMSNGKEVVNFSLGVSESWKDKETGEKKEKTEWINVTCFNESLVNVVKNYVKKGSKLHVSGKMQTTKYTDKNGVEKYATNILLQQLEFLSKKQETEQSEHDKAKADGYQPQPEIEDNVPF
jgi:single-strand DNA-binding protein